MTELAVALGVGLIVAASTLAVVQTVQAVADWLTARHPHRRP